MAKSNLDNEHYNLDSIYEMSIISSIILAGVAEAANKCTINNKIDDIEIDNTKRLRVVSFTN